MSNELTREIRKLEIRLEDYHKNVQKFLNDLGYCIKKLKELDTKIKEASANSSTKNLGDLAGLRLSVTRAFSDVLKSESEVEHEESHLLESYGAIVLSLEEALRNHIREGNSTSY